MHCLSGLLLLIAFCSLAHSQGCYSWGNCVDCLRNVSALCNWCDGSATCFSSTSVIWCRKGATTSEDACPSKFGIDNIGTRFLAIFVPIYILLTVVMVIIHYVRVYSIEPIIDFHVNRRGIMDFSALLDNKIEDVINSTLPPSEQLLWADVSLKISRWRQHLPALASFVFGTVILSMLSHFPSFAPYLAPLFVLLMVPCIFMITYGLHQIIRKSHYTHVYMLTSQGAIIVQQGLWRTKVYQFPYSVMVNIHSVHVMYKIASVYFAESWDISSFDPSRNFSGGSASSWWKNSKVGFENVVKAGEVEDLLRQHATQMSTTSPLNVAHPL